MAEIVRYHENTISVRDDLAETIVAVCIRCKGFKSIYATDYRSPGWPTVGGPGGITWMGHKVTCPSCRGKGLYRADDRPTMYAMYLV